MGEGAQRHAPRGNAASVDPTIERVRPRHLHQRVTDRSLHGMVSAHIAFQRPVLLPGQREKARMLARAVVVQRRGLAATARELDQGCLAEHGPVRPAFERGLVEIHSRQHPLHMRDVSELGGVRGAAQREFRASPTQRVGRPALDHGQRLDGLDGRAREDGALDLAARHDDGTVRVDRDERAAMRRLHAIAARHRHQDGAYHSVIPLPAPFARLGPLPHTAALEKSVCVA